MEKLANVSTLWPLLLVYALFTVVGAGLWIGILWNLLTGGPRDLAQPGQPYLYDRLYYLLFLVGLVGWTIGLLSFLAPIASGRTDEVSGFMVGWGIMAIGMGLLFRLRGEMMLKGAKYLSKHGFILWRPFYAMHVRQREQQPMVWKYMPLIFPIVGIGVLLFSLPHLAEVPGQVAAGAKIWLGWIGQVVHGRV